VADGVAPGCRQGEISGARFWLGGEGPARRRVRPPEKGGLDRLGRPSTWRPADRHLARRGADFRVVLGPNSEWWGGGASTCRRAPRRRSAPPASSARRRAHGGAGARGAGSTGARTSSGLLKPLEWRRRRGSTPSAAADRAGTWPGWIATAASCGRVRAPPPPPRWGGARIVVGHGRTSPAREVPRDRWGRGV